MTDGSDTTVPVVWIIVRQWPGGKTELISAHREEETARYAASRLISPDQFWLSLHSLEIKP
jgi:hypothetical protein